MTGQTTHNSGLDGKAGAPESDAAAGAAMSTALPPLTASARTARWAMAAILLLAAALLAKQIIVARIASRDAAAYYLPLARAIAAGDFNGGQLATIPPLYPMVVGALGAAFGAGPGGLELLGRLASAASALGLVGCVYLLGARIACRRVGVTAAALTAANYWVIRFGAEVGPDLLYALLLAVMALGLVTYLQRPGVWGAIAVGAAGGLAALTRSEGFLLVLLSAALMVLLPAPQRPLRWRRVGHALGMLVVVVAIWTPRLAYMRDVTGYPVLDARVRYNRLTGQSGLPGRLCDPPDHIVVSLKLPRQAGGFARPIGAVLQEAVESTIGVVGATVALLLVWWLTGRRVERFAPGLWALLALFVAELAAVSWVKMDRRYVVTVTGLAQVWGGLGGVAGMEWLRARWGWRGRIGQSIPRQLATLGLLVAGLALLSLLGTNAGTRHQELRTIGQSARMLLGEGARILAPTPEPAWYAQGKLVAVTNLREDSTDLDRDQVQYVYDLTAPQALVLQPSRSWASWISRMIEQGQLPDGAVLATAGEGDDLTYLLDTRLVLLSGQGPASRPLTESQALPAATATSPWAPSTDRQPRS